MDEMVGLDVGALLGNAEVIGTGALVGGCVS